MIRGTPAAVAQLTATSFNPLDPIGSILDSALNDVEKSIDKLANQVRDIANNAILSAAEQARSLIVSLQVAYADSLQKTYETADKILRQNIDRVGNLVKDIINENSEALLKVADRIEEIVKLSPLSNWWLPLLSRMSPEFVAVELAPDNTPPVITSVLLKFFGNFAYADRPGCAPTFVLNGRPYTPVANTTKELTFDVGISSDDLKLSANRCTFIKGQLEVQWKDGYFSWTKSTYNSLIGTLPSPGKISVVFTKAVKHETQTFTSIQ